MVVNPYDEIARRFFNEFLELKLALEAEGAITPDQQTQARKQYEKELAKWKKANEELKKSAQVLAQQLSEVESENEKLTAQNSELRLQVNELLIKTESMRAKHNIPRDEPGQYPLTQHMSERAFKEWRRIMQELPNLRGDDNA